MSYSATMQPVPKPSRAALEHLRKLAVQRVTAGETQVAVAKSLGVKPNAVCRWVGIGRTQGFEALNSRKPPGRNRTLSRKQEQRLFKLLAEKSPRQLKFSYALWTLPLVGELVERLFGVVLHKSTLGRLLRHLGFSPQRPRQRAFQRDDAACDTWSKKTFPLIVKKVRRRRGMLLFLDECGVQEQGPLARTWAPRGKRPVVRTSGKRNRINVISAVSPRGRLWFRCFRGNLNSTRFIGFLRELLQDIPGHLSIVLDGHPAHVSAMTRRFLKSSSRLSVDRLPGYAPDLNPDEHVWGILKGIFRKEPLMLGQNLAGVVAQRMTTIAENRRRLAKLLHHPDLQYIRQALRT